VAELHLSQNPQADELLSENPLALLIGMVLDQQVPLEWAFSGPLELQKRMGRPIDAHVIAEMEPEALSELFSRKPALHRYPGSMAKRVQELAQLLVEEYGGQAENLWRGTTSGTELIARIRRLPGFGQHKAKIFVALLGKQLGVRPEGWAEVSSPFSDQGSLRSVADIVDEQSLRDVRAFKQEMKAKAKAEAPAGAHR
jgi:uncharacterized HhH-GPD family protein